MENYSKSFTGGLRYETWNWTWPFAQLTVSPNTIDIELAGKNKFSFMPDQVIGFKKRWFGIQIFHNIKDYPSLIIFWGNYKKISSAIEEAGFKPTAEGIMEDDEFTLHKYALVVGIIFILSILILGIIIDINTN
jgi:hypothetical protein